MTRAQSVAWGLYISRIQDLLNEQRRSFEAGHDLSGLSIRPPTKAHVAMVDAALDEAGREAAEQVTHSVLDPLVRAIDAIDNSKGVKRSPVISELYETLSSVYDDLHKVKRELQQASNDANPTPPKP